MSTVKSNIMYILFVAIVVPLFIILFVNMLRNNSRTNLSQNYDTIINLTDYYKIKVNNAIIVSDTHQMYFTFNYKLKGGYTEVPFEAPFVESVKIDYSTSKEFFVEHEDELARYYVIIDMPEKFNYIDLVVAAINPEHQEEDSIDEFGDIVTGEIIPEEKKTETIRIDYNDILIMTSSEKESYVTSKVPISDEDIAVDAESVDEIEPTPSETLETTISSSTTTSPDTSQTTSPSSVTAGPEQSTTTTPSTKPTSTTTPNTTTTTTVQSGNAGGGGAGGGGGGGAITTTTTTTTTATTAKSTTTTTTPKTTTTTKATTTTSKATTKATKKATTTTTAKVTTTTTTTAKTTTKATDSGTRVLSIALKTDFTNNNVILNVSQSTFAEAVIQPSNACNKNVTWKSNRPDIASVSSDGKITAVSPGRAIIIATTEDGGLQASCMVTVS